VRPSSSSLRVRDFGRGGLRIACREGTIDERAIERWREWLEQPSPRPGEPRPDDTILDVGAHIGGFTLLAAGLVPEGRVLAVEACRESYEMLLHNIELNGLRNVEAAHLALSDCSGEARLYYDAAGNWGHTITKPMDAGGEPVPTETLAAYLRDRGVDRCDMAKLNCEGAEFPILMGASAETLRKLRRMLVFYHLDLVEEPDALAGLERHLSDAGFELEHFGKGGGRGYLSARLDDS
jgi:FkbM family methyltransferase